MATKNNVELSRELRRLLAGRTQQWLAKRANVAQSTISRIMRGVQEPEPETLAAFARALDVDPRHLLSLAGIPVADHRHHPTASYIAQRLDSLPDHVQEHALEAVGAVVDQFARLGAGQPTGHAAISPDTMAQRVFAVDEQTYTQLIQLCHLVIQGGRTRDETEEIDDVVAAHRLAALVAAVMRGSVPSSDEGGSSA